MEVEIAPFIHNVGNLYQSISRSDNSFVDVPPARENKSHKMLTIFYRTASQRDLALAVNVGERFIVDLESGKPTCQLGKALAVARGVGIRLTDTAPALSGDELPATGPADAYP